jgi:23S rRNA (cytosine1962-C5)-methyltransferase
MSPLPEVVLRTAGVRAVERGHPWIYKDAVARAPNLDHGEIVLVGEDKKKVGVGLYDSESPLAVRVWSPSTHAPPSRLLLERLQGCVRIRGELFESDTTAFRVAHGEGDRVPGIVIDRYGDVCVVKPDGRAAETLVRDHVKVIVEALAPFGLSALVLRQREQEAEALFGGLPQGPLDVLEHGVPFKVDVLRGQKTGAFLDQRENRRRIGQIVRAKATASGAGTVTVLNLFSYAGGFSIHAARAGAITTSVDIAAAAHKTAMDSFRLAGLPPKGHTFATADAFVFLERAAAEGKSWDVVISDPPSFAPNAKSLPRAISAYRKLHGACVKVLAKGGVFCAASCSSHVDATAFATTLDDQALGRADLRIAESFGPPADHPTLAAWPEGRYLKFFVLR